jgi:hypothetical protein
MEYKRIYRLKPKQQEAFAAFPEVYQGVQVGRITHGSWTDVVCLVIGGLVAVVVQDDLLIELKAFLSATWRPPQPTLTSIVQRYEDWLQMLHEPDKLEPIDSSRDFVAFAVSTNIPPPPPNRTSVTPAPPGPPPGGGTAVYGHLPFRSITEDREVFFRWEPWPTSRRVLTATNIIVPDTFASPHSEVPFVPTGFAAVARASLPSLFPAVFRYELKPPIATAILCGAVVPMFGQSGGGVEVCFTNQFANQGPIAQPIVIPPF